MATIASRLTKTGTLLVNGNIDEVTLPPLVAGVPVANRILPDSVYITGQFDEVTYNTSSPTIKNLLTYTEQLNNAVWYKGNVTVTTSAAVSPDGTNTANKVYEDASSAQHGIQYGAVTKSASANVTLSVYAKAAERSWIGLIINDDIGGFGVGRYGAEFDLIAVASMNHDGAQGTYRNGSNSITSVGNGWYRCSIMCTTSTEARVRARVYVFNNTTGATNANVTTWTSGATYTGDGTSGLYLWHPQMEIGSTSIYQGIAAANTLVTPSFAKRETKTGDMYVTSIYDEFTGAPVVDSSLLWWYDGAQTASYVGTGTQIRNLANTAQTGTLPANVAYSSVDGGKFVFNNELDATNQITAGNIGYPTSVNDPWTIEAWIYVPTGATWSINNNIGPLYVRGSYAGAIGLVKMQADNTVGVYLRGNTTAHSYQTGTTVRDKWNQVVGVWTGGTGGNLQCYVNGTLSQYSTTTQDDPIDQSFWIIGGNAGLSNNTGAVFVGSISNTKLYSKALSADEVAQNFNALRRRYNI